MNTEIERETSLANQSQDRFPPGGLAIVVGAKGAIGHAFLSLLGNDDDFAEVAGLSRYGEYPLDLDDEATIARAAVRLSAVGAPLRLVLDATGFLHDDDFMPEKTWSSLDPAHLTRSFAANAIGPAMVAPARGETSPHHN